MSSRATTSRSRPTSLPGRLSAVLIASATLQAGLTLLQATLAGHLLSGNATARLAHEFVATGLIMWVAAAQIVLAVLLWRPARGPAWPLAATTALFGLLLLQLGWGYGRRIALHIPVGVSFLAAQILLAISLRAQTRRSGLGAQR